MAETLVSDFTVRLWVDGDRARVEVIGNRTGRSASRPSGIGIMWVFALVRALRDLGALGRPTVPAPTCPHLHQYKVAAPGGNCLRWKCLDCGERSSRAGLRVGESADDF